MSSQSVLQIHLCGWFYGDDSWLLQPLGCATEELEIYGRHTLRQDDFINPQGCKSIVDEWALRLGLQDSHSFRRSLASDLGPYLWSLFTDPSQCRWGRSFSCANN